MDIESPRLPLIVSRAYSSSNSVEDLSYHSTGADTSRSSQQQAPLKKREALAWLIIAVQAFALIASLQSSAKDHVPHNFTSTMKKPALLTSTPLSINNRPPSYHEDKLIKASSPSSTKRESSSAAQPFYDPPTYYPANAGLVSRVWHSNGSPDINPGLQKGACWCSGDDFCMCTPALAIDMVLTSGPDHVWMVEREGTGEMALMGGFNEVGETVEEACRRELKEEMNLDLPSQPLSLFGVYSDPKRDSRKHAVSVVFHMDVPPHAVPVPGDDAKRVVRVPFVDVDKMDMFIDHKTVLHDFMRQRRPQQHVSNNNENQESIRQPSDEDPFKRAVCSH